VVLNGGTGKSLPEQTNPEELQDHMAVPLLGVVPQQAAIRKNPAASAAVIKKLPRFMKELRRTCGLNAPS
jgi:hypothetical protein